MGLVSIPRGFYYPGPIVGIPTAFASVGTIDAATEKVAFMGRVYIDGRPGSSKTISAAGGGSISFRASTVTFANGGTTIDIGIQDISATGNPAQPDGTFDVKRTLTGGVDTITGTAWNTFAMTGGSGSKSIAHGDHIAIVFDMTARAGADSVIVSGLGAASAFGRTAGQMGAQPGATAFNGGVWQGGTVTAPAAVITFDDGTIGTFDPVYPHVQGTVENFTNATNPDERGNLFQVPFDCKVDAIIATINASGSLTTGDFSVRLYADPLGTPSMLVDTAITDETYMTSINMDAVLTLTLPTEISLSKNTNYAVVIKATGTGSLDMGLTTLNAEAWRALFPGGTTVAKVTRNNETGAFIAESPALTRYLTCVRISQVNDGAGAGGGLIVNPGLSGGML